MGNQGEISRQTIREQATKEFLPYLILDEYPENKIVGLIYKAQLSWGAKKFNKGDVRETFSIAKSNYERIKKLLAVHTNGDRYQDVREDLLDMFNQDLSIALIKEFEKHIKLGESAKTAINNSLQQDPIVSQMETLLQSAYTKKPPEPVEKKETVPPEKKTEQYFLQQLADKRDSFSTWTKAYFGGEHNYSVPETPVIVETPKSVVSHEDLTIAIMQSTGCDLQKAKGDANNVLQFMGFDGIVLQNKFDNAGKGQGKLFVELFRKLEDIGLAYPYIVEDVKFRGWKSQYWILNERNIRKSIEEHKKGKEAPKEESAEELYAKLFAEGIPTNGNGNGNDSNGNNAYSK